MHSVSTTTDAIQPTLAMGMYAVISPHLEKNQELMSTLPRVQNELEESIQKLKKEIQVLCDKNSLWAIHPATQQKGFPARIDQLESRIESMRKRVARLKEAVSMKPLSSSKLQEKPLTPSLFGEDTK